MSEKKENPVMSFIDTKLIPVSQRIADNKYIKCLAGGSMSLMAIILIGAVFNLLNSIGFEWYQNFIQGIGINYLFCSFRILVISQHGIRPSADDFACHILRVG